MPRQTVSDRKPGHFIAVVTGPWEGKGSWVYRVRCNPCNFEQIEDDREAAWEVVADHGRQEVPEPQEIDLEDGEVWEEV